MCERCLAEPRRAIEEDVLGLVIAALGGREEDAKVLFDTRLSDIFLPIGRAQGRVERARGFFNAILCFCIHTEALRSAQGRARRLLTSGFNMLYSRLVPPSRDSH